MTHDTNNLMEKIVSLAKRRGFIFQSGEIYGGLGGFWDFGPIGILLSNNIKSAWWEEIVQKNQNIIGLDSSIITNPKTWEASGHLSGFADLMTDCKNCKRRFRADHLIEDNLEESGIAGSENIESINKKLAKIKCPECGGELTKARPFNLMFKTFTGPVEDTASTVYLRPETCQSIFINFKNIKDSMRLKVPFGIAQIGKTFRNEITPGNFIFRSREFEQMELEFFIDPKEEKKWLLYWKKERLNWYLNLGIKKGNLRFREHESSERAHYAKEAFDIEYNFPFGWKELEGIANRTDYDLKSHSKVSGQDLSYNNEEGNKSFIPFVIEPSVGVERAVLAFIIDSYTEEMAPSASGGKEERTVLKLDKRLSPFKVAVLPLSKNSELTPISKKIYDMLKECFMCDYDETQSIGRRYRRQDEIGTPFCVTIDFDTKKDEAVTIRDRDTMTQERVKIKDLISVLEGKLK